MMTMMSNVSAADRDFLSGAEGFFTRYVKNRAYYPKCEDAYECTERQYMALTGKRRYRSYDSFRSAYSQYYKRQQ